MIKGVFSLFLAATLFAGCSKTEVQIPAYIQVGSYYTKVSHAGSDSTQGTNNQNFTDVLVYANGQAYGTYPLGSKIPVLTSGPTNFTLRGVVEMNGVSALRPDYEVMKGCDTTISVTPGKITKVIPVFEYRSTTQFRWMEDFESGNQSNSQGGLVSSYGSNHPSTATTYSPGFGGKGYCLALKSNDTVVASVQTKYTVNLPAGGVGVYMELNYLSNTALHVYINGVDGGGIYPSSSWKKMYLTLTEQVSNLRAGAYTVTIYADYDPSVGTNLALIDNIKIVTAL